jgi:hypothetical protein
MNMQYNMCILETDTSGQGKYRQLARQMPLRLQLACHVTWAFWLDPLAARL